MQREPDQKAWAILVDETEHVLITPRCSTPEQWGFLGDFIHPCESALQAALRATQKVGLHLDVDSADSITSSAFFYTKQNKWFIFRLNSRPDFPEVVNHKWVRKEELPTQLSLHESVTKFLELAAEGLGSRYW